MDRRLSQASSRSKRRRRMQPCPVSHQTVKTMMTMARVTTVLTPFIRRRARVVLGRWWREQGGRSRRRTRSVTSISSFHMRVSSSNSEYWNSFGPTSMVKQSESKSKTRASKTPRRRHQETQPQPRTIAMTSRRTFSSRRKCTCSTSCSSPSSARKRSVSTCHRHSSCSSLPTARTLGGSSRCSSLTTCSSSSSRSQSATYPRSSSCGSVKAKSMSRTRS